MVRSDLNSFQAQTKCSEIGRDLFLIEKKYEAKTAKNGMDITGPYWMLVQVRVLRGQIAWKVKNEIARPKHKTVWLYVPPFSWTSEVYTAGTRIHLFGLFSSLAPGLDWPRHSIVFHSHQENPKSFEDISKLFKTISSHQVVDIQPNPEGAAKKVKGLLDQSFNQDISMKEISLKLKTSGPVISRQFKKSFGFTPVEYKRGLRVTAAMFHLLSGKSSAEAAFLAGYQDLGRFYKQFKQYIKTTPETHRIRKSQKTPRL